MQNLLAVFLLLYAIWTPIYVFLNSSIDEVEDVTFENIIPFLGYVGMPTEEIEQKIKALNSLKVETDQGLLDALEDSDSIENIKITVVKTEKRKWKRDDFFNRDLDTVELTFDGKNNRNGKGNRKYKLRFAVMDKDWLVPDTSKMLMLESISDSIKGEYSIDEMGDFFVNVYHSDKKSLF
jgi:hypothetical protein